MASLSVGQRIRVTGDDGLSQRALLLAPDGDSYEIEFDRGGEAVVPAERCAMLLPFEETALPADGDIDPERQKAQGNALFKLRDANAAIEQYVLGLRALSSEATPGARCLIKPAVRNGPLRSALVLTTEAKSVEVAYEATEPTLAGTSGSDTSARLQMLLRQAETISDGATEAVRPAPPMPEPAPAAVNSSRWWPSSSWFAAAPAESSVGNDHEDDDGDGDSEEEEEEEVVARERIVVVVSGQRPMLQCALLLNAAKCSLLLKQGAAAIARASRAEAIAAHDTLDLRAALAHRRTALLVCS